MTEHTLPLREFTAAKAVLIHNGRVLFLRESGSYVEGSNPGKYDIPGGRLNPGEGWDAGLKREVFEETGLTIAGGTPFWARDWRVKRADEEWHIRAVFFAVSVDTDQVRLSIDHDHYLWIIPDQAHVDIPILRGYDEMLNELQKRFLYLFQEYQGAA